MKRNWPDWVPPPREMIERSPEIVAECDEEWMTDKIYLNLKA